MLNAGTKFGHYEILSPIGKGGMGEVYLAQDAELERRVALQGLAETDESAGMNFYKKWSDGRRARARHRNGDNVSSLVCLISVG